MKEGVSTEEAAVEDKGLVQAKKKRRKWSGNILSFVLVSLALPGAVYAGLACLSNPCINGICIDDLNSTYSCYCIDGFTGIQCQTNWDECWSSPCKNGGSCIDGIAEYNCTCPDGYIGDDCEVDFDECDSNPCLNNATCMDGPNGFTCACLPGYSGLFCDIDIAVCNQTEETRCSNGGKCIDGPGMSFECSCVSGWEGKLCESPINECLSSPCENGGLCIDLHADYTCACTFGYTGKNCEAEIELCTNSPCINNALCMLENTIRTCYCVPDYHGEKCQYQYDECLLGPRCMNGGTCIDGVDNFTCSCPPSLTGVLCECLILDNGEYDCDYVSPTPIYEARVDTTSGLITMQDNVTVFSISTTYRTSDYSTADTSSSYMSSESSLQTFVPTKTWDQITSTTFNDNFITIMTDLPFTFKQTQSYLNATDDISIDSTTATYVESTSSIEDVNAVYSTMYTTTNKEIVPDLTTYIAEYSTSEKEMTSAETQSTSEIDITKLITDYKTEPSITIKTTDLIYPDITTTDYIETSTGREFLYSTIYIAPDLSNTLTTLRNEASTTDSYANITMSTEEFTTDFVSTTRDTSNQFTKSYFATTEETFITTNTFDYPVITTESFDCKNIKCLNGGSCIKLAAGPKCVCKFDFDGPLCERSLGVAAAAFSGDSYLTHKLYNASGIRIQLKARTLSTEGMILYSNIGFDTYMCLYISKGHLKFKFSCGYQTMLLSELDIPFNNGYEFRIKAILEFTDNKRHCNASLHINDTLAMSGGQIAAPAKYPPHDSWLHLGAIPEGYGVTNHSPPDIDAFTGCMMNLQIHDKLLHIFKNASDGFEVKECTALSCLSNPCLNAGTCSEVGEHSICYCSNGFLGRYCERSVCEINPCQFGGTCVQHPGSGFLCLCPLGKHGLYCEHNLEITQPLFSSMVQGLSSFVVYQFPKNLITQGFELRFTIEPNTIDQISLLAFLGQSGPHDPKSDHLAVTFVKGYLMLTWNLGNGPRRIFTSRPINHKVGRSHTVKVGRMGRAAWLSVDNLQNITGNAPGNQINFDVLPYLYIGGHDSVNFSQLPHDLPLHGGFAGCIWDIWVGNMGAKNGDGGVLRVPIKGRAVGQCSVTQCHSMICHNEGACLHHAATYSCLCPQNWFGPLCTSKGNPCDTFASKCRSGSTCVPTMRGYQCDCPLGYAGKLCDRAVDFSDVSLSGVRSYLKLNVKPFGEVHFNVELEVHPMHPKGIIFYAYSQDGCFVSLSLQGGLLEYRWAGYEWGGKSSHTRVIVIVRSGVVLSLDSWHTIRAGRYGRKLYLWVDGTMTTKTFNQHQSFTSFNTSIYIGGVHDLSTLPMDVMSGHPMSYTGCVRKVVINSQRFPLNKDNIIESRNIDDCDGDVCGGDVCWNGGTCIITEENGLNMPKCICPQPYAYPNCMEMLPCKPDGCNKGRCINNTCICPSGWRGHTCENQIKMKNPQFGGSSYIMIDDGDIAPPAIEKTNSKIQYKRNLDNIYINFTTAQSNGLLLWGEMNNKKYVSLGLEGGFLKISWTLPQSGPMKSNITKRALSVTKWPAEPFPQTGTIKLIQSGRLSNGEWHTIHFKFQPGNISVLTDNKTAYEESGLSYNINKDDVIMFIGGLPKNVSLVHRTDGLYSSNFVGCISEVSFGTSKDTITDFSHFESENVEVCQLNF